MIIEKRTRDRNLTRMKKQAEKQKEMAEKIEKRARATLQIDDAMQGTVCHIVTVKILFRPSLKLRYL